MVNLETTEKFINSELTTKINDSFIKHSELKLFTDGNDLVEVILFL